MESGLWAVESEKRYESLGRGRGMATLGATTTGATPNHRYCRIRGKESAATDLQMDFDTVESSESPEMRECRLASKREEFAAYPV
jgi:hypothetical protein